MKKQFNPETDTYEINCSDYYFNPSYVEIPAGCRRLNIYQVDQFVFDRLKIPFSLEELVLINGALNKLIVPEGISYVICDDLGLEEIHLPRTIKTLYCSKNYLLEITVPKDIEYVDVSNNGMRMFKAEGKLEYITYMNLKGNRIKRIDFDVGEELAEMEIEVDNPFIKINPNIIAIIKKNQEELSQKYA